MSFSDQEEDILINLVCKYPILYDASHAEHRNILAKENVWKDIAQELKKTNDDCKKKWKFMRDGYYRFKKRCKTGSVAPKNSKYKRHRQLSFLDQHKPGGPNLPASPTNENEDNTDTNQENDEEQIFTGHLEIVQDEDMLNTHSPETINIKQELPDEKLNEPLIQNQKQKHQKDAISRGKIMKMWKGRKINRKRLLKPTMKKKDDGVELFCRHIAEVLRSLPPVYKAEAKKEIGAIVSDYEIKAARSKSKPSFTASDINTDATPSSSSSSQYSSN